ncbi:hypothetical protein ACJX0J_031523, partial [Zea mays]
GGAVDQTDERTACVLLLEIICTSRVDVDVMLEYQLKVGCVAVLFGLYFPKAEPNNILKKKQEATKGVDISIPHF